MKLKEEKILASFAFKKNDRSFKTNLEQMVKEGRNLAGIDLKGIDLTGINLTDADLINSNLQYTNFCGATLIGADFRGADLRYANFDSADLRYADLRAANFSETSLIYTNLRYAKIGDTAFNNTNTDKAKYFPFIPVYLPEGEFIAWKQLENGLIVKLKILADSKRSRATGDKCRCDKALVLEFQNEDGTISQETEYTNTTFTKCKYKVGEAVYADEWDDNRWNECSHGIHFFIDRQSAVNYLRV